MNPSLEHSLRTIVDFLNWHNRFKDIQGYLNDVEGYTLLQMAATGGGVGAIVEIGSFMGRSTAFLAAGSKQAGRERVFAVDHFRGSPEHQPGQNHAVAAIAQAGTTLPEFRRNLESVGLADHVTAIVASSAEAASKWSGPIRLLFIDGDHSYDESKRDYELWSPHVVPGGVICFHDIQVWPGVTQYYAELMKQNSSFREVGAVLSLRMIERVAQS